MTIEHYKIQLHKCPQCEYTFWQPMGFSLPPCVTCRAKPDPVGEWEDHIVDTSKTAGFDLKEL